MQTLCASPTSSGSGISIDIPNRSKDLKPDHDLRPLYIHESGQIILERFSPLFVQAQDLLVTIAEPVTRPLRVHEYKLTEYSLYAAMSMGLGCTEICKALETLSKTNVPLKIIKFITKVGEKMGKIRILLKQGEYYLEFWEEEMLEKVRDDRVLAECLAGQGERALMETGGFRVPIQERIPKVVEPIVDQEPEGIDLFDLFEDDELVQMDLEQYDVDRSIPAVENVETVERADETREQVSQPTSSEIPLQVPQQIENDIPNEEQELLDPEDGPIDQWIFTIKIIKEKIEIVKKRCAELQLPLLEEYDFKNDSRLPKLNIDLKPATKLRPYQEQSLGKMFGNGRARSGVVVLPCGAGKTLVGVTAACTIKKSCLVLCNSTLSVEQWAREFRYWSTIKPDEQLAKFSSESKQMFTSEAGVLISTYTMISYSGKRAYDAQKMMEFIQSREWGFVLLDEVHVVPADMFKKALTIVAAHSKLGLTATLVREDDKIDSLNWLIGPKLYEANWLELVHDGFIANVQCAEVWCTMATPFYREYLRATSRKKQLLYVMNPHKLQACQYLVQLHESMGDKIIVFSDNIFALKV